MGLSRFRPSLAISTALAYGFISSTVAQTFPLPELTFAFTASIYVYASGPPIPFPGYKQTFAVAVNSTLSGPLLNATLVSFNGVEQDFNPSTGSKISYFTSQGYGVYIMDDGVSFNWRQIGYTLNTSQAFWANLGGIGGRYVYLRQYLISCYSLLQISYNFNATTETATKAATAMPSAITTALASSGATSHVVAHEAIADCYVVGGV